MRTLLAVSLVLAGIVEPSAAQREETSKAFHPVVVISIDGLRPDALSDTRTPNILALARRGASTWLAETVKPSETLPAHISMFTGEIPDVHGVVWDEYRPAAKMRLTTVFSLASERALLPVFVVGKSKLKHLAPDSAPFILCGRGDDEVANEAMVRAQLPFDLLFVHFPGPDLMGHSKGWMTTAYFDQVAQTDASIGRLLAAVPATATVILTADHGGIGNNHADTTLIQNTRIPWVIAGPTVRKGYSLRRAVRTVDTAATVAYLLGFTLPASVPGRPVSEAFEE